MNAPADPAMLGTALDFARWRGVSHQYVSQLQRQGRLVMRESGGRRLVDFEASARLIDETGDMARADNGANAPRKGTRAPSAASAAAASPQDGVGDLFRKAQAQERAFRAKRAELQFHREAGAQVPIAEVRAAYAARIAAMRDALLQIPARLQAVLAAETDEARVHDLIADEIYLVLAQVAEAQPQQ